MSKDFKEIARKIKRRIIVSAIIILVTLMATTSILNYKASQGNEEPFIALGTNYEFGDETTIKITTSIGFKHIKYESRYGKNYSECVPFWKSYDKNPVSISADQYEKIREHIENSILVEKVLPVTILMFSVLMKRMSLTLLKPEIKWKSTC